jgi:transcriptional regulator with XRE-family HTH domain
MTAQFVNWLEKAMLEYGGRKYGGAALARDLNSSSATISNWLNGKRPPDREHITLLALHFGVTSRYIYQLLGIDPPDNLNDLLERVNTKTYHLNRQALEKLLKDLEGGKYGG